MPFPDHLEDREWTVAGELLTGRQLRAAYDGLASEGDRDVRHRRFARALGAGTMLSDRRADRALQILRKAGAIAYDRATRTWAVVP